MSIICRSGAVARSRSLPCPRFVTMVFGHKRRKKKKTLSVLSSPSSLHATSSAFLLAELPDTERWGSHQGSAAIMARALEVDSGERKTEEWRLCKGLPGMNALLCQSKGLELSHLSYSSLASPTEGPTQRGRKTHWIIAAAAERIFAGWCQRRIAVGSGTWITA